MTSLGGPNATESRPVRDSPHKKMSTFLQRISPHRRTANVSTIHSNARSNSSQNLSDVAAASNSNDNNNNASDGEITRSSSMSALQSSASSVPTKSSKPFRRSTTSLRSFLTVKAPGTFGASQNTSAAGAKHDSRQNVMHWLESECPPDLLPKVMAFAGPKMMTTVACVNRHWREFFLQEATWKALSEELYKWKEGDDVPTSWKQFYITNPCIPIDCPTIQSAITKAGFVRQGKAPTRSIRIFLRPGRYILREAIVVQTATPDVCIKLETMAIPDAFNGHTDLESNIHIQDAPTPPSRRRSKLRQLLSCRSTESVADELLNDDSSVGELEDPMLNVSTIANEVAGSPKRATLILRSRRSNQPFVRVQQGICSLKNIDIHHISTGTDIWNGNAAVQIQPPLGPDEQPLTMMRPKAILDQVDVTSLSGRGIVNIDGGDVSIRNCHVHDCAATGIYVGGPGSRAIIDKTDVVRNGFGNRYHRRGIARGHSGVYLEQGHARITDCNISHNSLTGISAVSPENAILNLSDSDLMSNGSFQLEMPALGTIARRASLTENNTMASFGMARARSGLAPSDEEDEEGEA